MKSQWQIVIMSFSVVGFAMKPQIPLDQLRGGKISRKRVMEWSWQVPCNCWKVPWDSVSMIHVVDIMECQETGTDKKRQEKKQVVDECQSQSSSMSDVCFLDTLPAAKRLRSSLGQIHNKTKCAWWVKMTNFHTCTTWGSDYLLWPHQRSYLWGAWAGPSSETIALSFIGMASQRTEPSHPTSKASWRGSLGARLDFNPALRGSTAN